jgi:tRNA(fMet)-specific endonuclease VapC
LDTSTISLAIRRNSDQRVLRLMSEHGQQCAMASLTWHELRYGVLRLPKGKRRADLIGFFEEVLAPSVEVLPYDERAAAWHATERVRLEKLGKPKPFVDGQIAAIGVTNGLPVVTANPKDFHGFKGLGILNWASG